ncbi:SDR family NAD(P)-dependent oxidoreductase [Agrococcus beijingensis]|uniref:SDR family NAD(P)-dependent oxidoreductase n=1 Tax=Agrococcus beijingensis TaxID=3068634 RepID=UPI002741FECD|nr:SDR family NAD(P)-dependent oxidoreductase [Agrococcus sp. REN33]
MTGGLAVGAGKTALVTGATSGIGKETALALSRVGFNVVILGRNAAKTSDAAAWLRGQSGSAAVDVLVADLTSQSQVRRAAREFRAAHARLDVLVNNAGGVFPSWQLTEDGVERTWALNHLAPLLLALELLPLLRAGTPSRIVNVASGAHANGRIDLGAQHEEAAFSMDAYSNAKLANVLASYALARRLTGTGVTVNCVHPGVVGTSFGREAGGWIKAVSVIARPFLLSPARGAATSVHVATAPELESVTGAYFAKSSARRSSPASYDEALQERVWSAALSELGATALSLG